MKLHDLRPIEGSTKKRKRVGRGTGSGRGKTAGRGTKGQKSRSGGNIRIGFEGGQLALIQRVPKLKGFNNRFKVHYTPVNLDALEERFDRDTEVTPDTLFAVGLSRSEDEPVVILGRGSVSKPLKVQAHRISASARQKIEDAGGSVELLPFTVNRNRPRS